jgi:hypothetical protein
VGKIGGSKNMSSPSLHPLARQAIDLSARPDAYGWAFGLTKYLAYDDPAVCLRWTLEFLLPHIQHDADNEVIRRSVELVESVLAQPSQASLQAIEEFAWLPWSHRTTVNGAGPMARLIWAAMGVVKWSRPSHQSPDPPSEILHSDGDTRTDGRAMVWDQCATAIHMIAYDRPDISLLLAEAFTGTVCHEVPPSNAAATQRYQWWWEDLVFDIAVLRDGAGDFHVEFIDRQGTLPLYSGPFTTAEEVECRCDLLTYQPKTIRLERVQ